MTTKSIRKTRVGNATISSYDSRGKEKEPEINTKFKIVSAMHGGQETCFVIPRHVDKAYGIGFIGQHRNTLAEMLMQMLKEDRLSAREDTMVVLPILDALDDLGALKADEKVIVEMLEDPGGNAIERLGFNISAPKVTLDSPTSSKFGADDEIEGADADELKAYKRDLQRFHAMNAAETINLSDASKKVLADRKKKQAGNVTVIGRAVPAKNEKGEDGYRAASDPDGMVFVGENAEKRACLYDELRQENKYSGENAYAKNGGAPGNGIGSFGRGKSAF